MSGLAIGAGAVAGTAAVVGLGFATANKSPVHVNSLLGTKFVDGADKIATGTIVGGLVGALAGGTLLGAARLLQNKAPALSTGTAVAGAMMVLIGGFSALGTVGAASWAGY